MKIKLFLFIVILSFMSAIANSNEIVIASGHSEYPPFMWKAGKKIIGVGAELTSKIFEEIGIKVDCKYIGPWKRVQHEAKNGRLDLILGIYKNEDRIKYLAYPDESYTSDPVVIFVKKGKSFSFSGWDDLIGKNGGAIIGDSFGQSFDSFAKKNLNVYRMVKTQHGFRMIILGRLEYLIYGLYPGRIKTIEMELKNEIDYLPMHVIESNAYQAFSKKSKFLKHLPYFNKRIAELKADGTVLKLIEKYMAYWEKTLIDKGDLNRASQK